MGDVDPFVHGEEGTHIVCKARLIKEQGQARCCECVPHDGCLLGKAVCPVRNCLNIRASRGKKKSELAEGEDPFKRFSYCNYHRKSPKGKEERRAWRAETATA